jgi:hypothetical protein
VDFNCVRINNHGCNISDDLNILEAFILTVILTFMSCLDL